MVWFLIPMFVRFTLPEIKNRIFYFGRPEEQPKFNP